MSSRTKARLEDITGQLVRGFRAPTFSILPGMEWAFDVLLETGHTYDSSVFPIRRPGYGWPGAPTTPYDIVRPGGTLREYPMTTLDVFGLRVPAAGGGYLRQFPYGVIRRAFQNHQSEGSERDVLRAPVGGGPRASRASRAAGSRAYGTIGGWTGPCRGWSVC